MSFDMYGVPLPIEPPSPQSFYGMKHAFAEQFIKESDGGQRGEVEIASKHEHTVALIWLKGYISGSSSGQRVVAERLLKFIEDNPQGVHIWIGDWMDGPYGDAVDPDEDDDEDDEDIDFQDALDTPS